MSEEREALAKAVDNGAHLADHGIDEDFDLYRAVERIIAAREARARAEALREAADHFDRFDEVWIGEPGETDIGSNMVPVPPAERLRNMADQIGDDPQ